MIFKKFLNFNLVDHWSFFPFLFLVVSFIYLPCLGSSPFGDDFVYVFKNYHILDAKTPFVFWKYGSEQYKSWPFSFSFLWLENFFFSDKVIFYRLVNLALHTFNAYLFNKLINLEKSILRFFIAITFLLHPLVVENIIWIFQVKTLLSIAFFLQCLIFLFQFRDHLKLRHYFLSLFFFTISLLSKSSVIFFPLALPLFFKDSQQRKTSLFLIPFFLISIISGFENMKGVISNKGEETNIKQFQTQYFKNNTQQDLLAKKNASLVNTSNLKPAQTIYVKEEEIKKYFTSAMLYFNGLINFDSLSLKYLISTNAFFKYSLAIIGINSFTLVYPNLDLSEAYPYLITITLTLFICILIYFEIYLNLYFVLSFLFFLPISGFFYVPYMQYSFIADHWIYPSLPFLIWSLIHLSRRIIPERFFVQVLTLLILFLSMHTIFYTKQLGNLKEYFYTQLSTNRGNTQILTEYVVELEKNDKNFNQVISLLGKLYVITPNKKESVLENLIYFTTLTNNHQLSTKYRTEKSILLFKNNAVSRSLDNLNDIEPKNWSSSQIFLHALLEIALKRFNVNSIKQIDQLLVK